MTTVRDVLYGDAEDGLAGLVGQVGGMGLASAAVVGALAPSRVAAAVWNVLDIPLGDLLMRAWEQHRLIERAKAETAEQPGSIQHVQIAAHTMRSEHHPRIECEVEGRSIPVLTLTLSVALTIETVVVTVAAGQITGISPGKAKAVASLSAGDVELCRREVESVSLAGD